MKYKKVTQHIKRNFIVGLATVLPLFITLWILNFVIKFIHSKLKFLPQRFFPENPYVSIGFEIAIFLFLLFIIYLAGLFTSNYIGKKFLSFLEKSIETIPIVKTIYKAAKQLVEGITVTEKKAFKQVVLFPISKRKKIYIIGFITGSFFLKERNKKEEYSAVFLPTSPNVTTGAVMIIKTKELIFIDIPVETAFKFIISGGIISGIETQKIKQK